MKIIIPGKLTGRQAAKIIYKSMKDSDAHHTDFGISRMSLSQWRRGLSVPDTSSCVKIYHMMLCSGVDAEIVLKRPERSKK